MLVKTMYSLNESNIKVSELVSFLDKYPKEEVVIVDTMTTKSFYDLILNDKIVNKKIICGCTVNINRFDRILKVIIIAKNIQGIIRINKLISDNGKTVEFESIEKDLYISNAGIDGYFEYLIKHASDEERKTGLRKIEGIFPKSIIWRITEEPTVPNIKVDDYLVQNYTPVLHGNIVLFLEKTHFDNFLMYKAINEDVSFQVSRKQNKNLQDNYYKQTNVDNFQFSDYINYDLQQLYLSFSDNQFSFPYTLDELAINGLRKRENNQLRPEYVQRLKHELKVINTLGFSNYFLIVHDIIKYCFQNDIYVGPGRGSAAGSLVAYAVGITQIDPLKYNLKFSRFLNPSRKTMPDIDLDVEDQKRDEVVQYLIDKYGNYHAAKIGTYSHYLTKASVRSVLKSFNINKNKIDQVSKLIDSKKTFVQNLKENNKLQTIFFSDNDLQLTEDFITSMENQMNARSIHAAGVVLSAHSLLPYTPINNHITFNDAHNLEKMGILKYDILSLTNLTILHKIVNLVKKDYVDFSLVKINLKDTDPFSFFHRGQTLGIFQFESEGITKLAQRFKPNSIEDLSELLALYRPGPLNYLEEYLMNKDNSLKRYHPDPIVHKILSETKGIMIFQEQIIEIAEQYAGFSSEEADVFRAAISKQKSHLMIEIKEKFLQKCTENKKDYYLSLTLFEKISNFAKFGFNKSHAIAYSHISYQLLYLKYYYPNQFYSVLSEYKKELVFKEITQSDYEIIAPNIFQSHLKLFFSNSRVQLGFESLNNLSKSTLDKIVSLQSKISKDCNLINLINYDIRQFNFTLVELEIMIYGGIFDDVNENRFYLMEVFTQILNIDQDFIETNSQIVNVRVQTSDENFLAKKEYMSLGLNIRYDLYKTNFTKFKNIYPRLVMIEEKFSSLSNLQRENMRIMTLIKIISIKKHQTKNNKQMAFLQIKSKKETYDVTVFPEVFQKFEEIISSKTDDFLIVELVYKQGGFIMENITQN